MRQRAFRSVDRERGRGASCKGHFPFDHTYVLNLQANDSRMVRVARRLNRLGIEFERFAALPVSDLDRRETKPPLLHAYYAAGRSHRAVLTDALQRGFENVLVFEDDVVLRDDFGTQLRKLTPQLKSVEWDVLHLGIHLIEDGGPVANNLGLVREGFHAHAYVVRRKAIERLIEAIDHSQRDGVAFDNFGRRSLRRLYCNPILAIQEPGFSEILGWFFDRWRQYFPPFDEEDFLAHCREARRWHNSPAHEPASVCRALTRAADLRRRGDLRTAQAIYIDVLSSHPRNVEASHRLALIYFVQGRHELALDLLDRAARNGAHSAEFYSDSGAVLCKAGRTEEGLRAFARAIDLNPGSAAAHHNQAVALFRNKRVAEAAESWKRAVELQPNHVEALSSLGHALSELERYDDAMLHFRRALAIEPEHPDALCRLGLCHQKRGEFTEAISAYRRALLKQPKNPEILSNLGTALSDIGDRHAAIPLLEEATRLRPMWPEGRFNLAVALLSTGNWERGWLESEWRTFFPSARELANQFPCPFWHGGSLLGRTILVICEQGLGDTLQFIRFAPLLRDRGATSVVVACPATVARILKTVDGLSSLVSSIDKMPRFDVCVRLMSLPGILGIRLDNVPNQVPYLSADPTLVSSWARRIGKAGFRIGICWQGSKNYPGDARRSFPLALFTHIASIPGVRLISLQKGEGCEQIAAMRNEFELEELEPPFDEAPDAFVDTAAVMKNLDLVITSDTAVAHLAGGLGVRTWVALSTASDWRWLIERQDSPWYPSMQLFRQPSPGDWASVFRQMAEALRSAVESKPPLTPTDLAAPTSPGELLDRIAILRIKAERIIDASRNSAIRTELEKLERLAAREIPARAELRKIRTELYDVNRALWELEDNIRDCDHRGDFGTGFVEMAQNVYRTNDRRSEIKRRVNSILGWAGGEVKQYASYGREISETAPAMGTQRKGCKCQI